MSKLSLKVLLGVFALMFSASVGLSAVYECRFYARTTSDLRSGLFLIDEEEGTVKISSSNGLISKKAKGPHKINISDNGTKFSWYFQDMFDNSYGVSFSEDLNYEILLDKPNASTKASLNLRCTGWRCEKRPRRGTCKLIKADTVTAQVKTQTKTEVLKPTPAKPLEAFFLEQESYDRRNIQLALSDLGFYKSKIDGFYGPSTERALKEYNNEYLGAANLGKRYNVSALFKDILTPQIIEAEEKQPVPEPEQTPKLDMVQVQASYDAKDYRKAFADAQVLAVQGDPEAQLLLGKMFADGRGTIQVTTMAHMWFNIASMGGIDEAYEQRQAITDQMSPTAIDEAQKMAMKCIQSNYGDCSLAVTPTAVAQPKTVDKTYITSGSQVEAWFKDETQLKRKQLHYALKKLGVYNSSVDGLWGGNTSRAFTRYINKYKSDAETVEEVFASILSKVKVPSAFAEPKRVTTNKSTTRSNNAGLTAIISNPSMSGAQALAVCEPQAKLAGNQASSSYKSPSYGSSTLCTGFGNNFNCNSYSDSGGVWGGLADGIAKGLSGRRAKEAVMQSCLAQYGWKK